MVRHKGPLQNSQNCAGYFVTAPEYFSPDNPGSAEHSFQE